MNNKTKTTEGQMEIHFDTKWECPQCRMNAYYECASPLSKDKKIFKCANCNYEEVKTVPFKEEEKTLSQKQRIAAEILNHVWGIVCNTSEGVLKLAIRGLAAEYGVQLPKEETMRYD